MSGYLTLYGTDLSYIFINGTASTASGYYALQSGGDLSSLFKRVTSGSVNASPTGYLMPNNKDISTIYEPTQIAISNYNFASPATSTYYYNSSIAISGWSCQNYVLVGKGSPWTSLSSASIIPSSTQFCGLQLYLGSIPTIAQNVTFQNLMYVLSFWVTTRPPFVSTTQLIVNIGTTVILTYLPYQATPTWSKISVPFTTPTAGTYALRFTCSSPVNNNVDNTVLITGIYITIM